MNMLNLSEADYNYIKELLRKDAVEIASDISFFEQENVAPKSFIDERILLCEKFGIDFWNYIALSCSDFHTKQLKTLYNGGDLRHFIETYKVPNENELAKDLLQQLAKSMQNKK